MKNCARHLLLALALTAGGWVPVQAQTFKQLEEAFEGKDYRAAFVGFGKLAEQGDPFAQNYLGVMYEFGLGVPISEQLAAKWYRKAAEQGNAFAQFELGMRLSKGKGVPKDLQQAMAWFHKAAEQGDAIAQFNLGVGYANGEGAPKDEQQATAWFLKAAKQGVAKAQFNLGVRYGYGKGVPKDEQESMLWFFKAAEQGDVEAQYNLGVRYADGIGVPKDEQLAASWFLKAAEQGHAKARHNLGVGYANGEGVPKDEMQAMSWFQKAAEQGVANAQFELAKMYIVGRGAPKDDQTAYFWLLLASAKGHQTSKTLRDFIERQLSPEQRATAQASARSWQPKTAEQSRRATQEGTADQGRKDADPHLTDPTAAPADSSGSGVRVARGAIVTNHHVIAECSRLRVNGISAVVRGSDARSDLALLGVTLPGLSSSLRAQRAAVGEPVAVAGFPLRGLLSGFNVTFGNLSSLSGMSGDTRLMQISAPVQPGNSGGPMLDSAGNLMGVVVSKLDALKAAKLTGDIPQNVNFAINGNVLRAFLDANGVDYDSATSERPIGATAIAEKAKGFTVLVECWN
ncbi:trypsin-like peptidase domain-containing protein [Hydrogenophaga taeniospiralis]|uniref:trypsin-like peptidase domain-containing protein n=1 Tax=Hydrogenophaga taeniospiralis TaxID=65656 RepID=UPI001CFB667F|nr:trypsin-like peptidase domain-containing protein [Hydrogenophaga taeniospiralis]UCU92161.1 SEL1-like repeat protein [Hydrogenophaga taeniospiralis]